MALPVNLAAVHGIYGGDDIMHSKGWDDIFLYVAIDWEGDDVICADLNRQVVEDFCVANGWTPVDYSVLFDCFVGGWVRLSPEETEARFRRAAERANA